MKEVIVEIDFPKCKKTFCLALSAKCESQIKNFSPEIQKKFLKNKFKSKEIIFDNENQNWISKNGDISILPIDTEFKKDKKKAK